ncbi:MAG: molybdenum cofactor guanylyltransferase [Chloroflexi bacterium]|nr:molybdenum cofactor guanylyltransferase [Chloroflexota bacterium]
MLKVSAVVLAGGKSQRLGVDKALLKIDGEWLLERILNTMSALSDDLLVVANARPEFAGMRARSIPDAYPDTGPLGGIYTGLRAMRYERGLFVACDMPLLNLPLLRYIILLSADFDVVIPSTYGKTEPLHAVYSKACMRPIEKLLRSGERRIVSFFPEVRVRYVTESEVDTLDPKHLSFFNINTAEDLEMAKRLLHSQS